jgi:transcriptional regulator with XRE-family HTH domain
MFHEKVKETRVRRNMTQKQLADAAQIAVGSVSAYENGGELPPVDAAYRIASALGVSLNDMISPTTIKICTKSSNDKGGAS